jgi:hypothetical protein
MAFKTGKSGWRGAPGTVSRNSVQRSDGFVDTLGHIGKTCDPAMCLLSTSRVVAGLG